MKEHFSISILDLLEDISLGMHHQMERISSRQNAKLKKWKLKLKEKNSNFLLLSGKDLLSETIDFFVPDILLSAKEEELQSWIEKYADHSFHPIPYLLTSEILQDLCLLKNFQGTCAIGSIKRRFMPSSGRFLFLDGIQDPGNFGTIVRSCLAFDWNGLFYTPDCCSPYQQKVIRSSRGGVLKLPLQEITVSDFLQQSPHDQIWIAKKEGQPLNEFSFSLESSFVLVLGNEGHGPSSKWPATCPGIWIPIRGDSLNVSCAASLFLFTLK